ncbi:MAG TPA: WbqC family protein [Bacteroidales bacterium]|nr:WbqC family protein [Bacteroidales bacterium]HSA44074.1 WbqC family protein [Bacteroidales bacterium]
MSSCLLTTACLPPCEYFVVMLQSTEVVIEQWEHYGRQSYRNRYRIAGPNRIQDLSIPVEKPGGAKVFSRDVMISRAENWQRLHWYSITAAYNKSPYFLYYQDDLKPFYQNSFRFLLDYNTALLQLLMKWLKITTDINFTNEYQAFPGIPDFRDRIHPKKPASLTMPPYHQVFAGKSGFITGLSIIDLVFNLGPESHAYLKAFNFLSLFGE